MYFSLQNSSALSQRDYFQFAFKPSHLLYVRTNHLMLHVSFSEHRKMKLLLRICTQIHVPSSFRLERKQISSSRVKTAF